MRVRRLDAAALLFSAAFAVWLAFFSHGDAARRDLIDTLFFLPPGGAVAWITWRTAREWPHDPATSKAWRLLALSHLLAWIGGSVWGSLLLFAPGLAHSRAVDALSLPAYPLALWAVLSFPGLYPYGASRTRLALEAALMTVGAGLAAWYFGYLPALASNEPTGEALYIAFLFPAIDLALLGMTGASGLRATHPVTRTALRWLFASKLAVAAGDGYYGLLRLTSGYHPGHPVDAFWFAAWLLAWCAARSAQAPLARGATATPVERARTYRSELVAPLFVVFGEALLLWVLRGRLQTRLGFAAIASGVITALIILRQLAELGESNRLFEQERRQEARFRSLVQQGHDVILVVDAEGAVLYGSPSAERLFGPAPASGVRRLGDLFDASAALAALLAGEAKGPVAVRFGRPGAPLVHLEFVATDLRADPAVGGWVLTGRDVSEQKALEDEMLHAQKMRAIGQLAGGFAHDLNNLIAALRGHLDLVIDELPPGSPARLCADDIAVAADRAASITRHLLQFGRRDVVRPVRLDLNAVLLALEPMLLRLLPPRIALRLEPGPGPLWILIDRDQLEQAVLNLAVNARDAMPRGGTLRLRTLAEPSGRVSLVVADEGLGIDAATLPRIFEPFFTTKPPEKGTGLGLATVQSCVTGAGGEIQVASEPGRGTTFTLLFPQSSPATVGPVPALPLQATGGEGARVLVVDDDEMVRRVSARLLERKGYRVSQAGSGEQALELLEREEVDLVLTDLMMPGMGGAGLLTRLAEAFPHLPVICMSGHAADEASRRLAGSSTVTFVSKPFSAEEIFEAIAAALAYRDV